MTETTLTPVTFVRDVTGEPYKPTTQNKLWQGNDGRYMVTSWSPGDDEVGPETLGFQSDEDGFPDPVAMTLFIYGGGPDPWVEGEEPQHEAALAKLGYQVVPE